MGGGARPKTMVDRSHATSRPKSTLKVTDNVATENIKRDTG